MRFVPVKSAEQQAALMLVGVRDQLVNRRTQLSNAIRGYAGGTNKRMGRARPSRRTTRPERGDA
jgi:transposase